MGGTWISNSNLGENGMQDNDFFFSQQNILRQLILVDCLSILMLGDAIQHNYIASYRTKK